jgi:23S rRNA pseudouridine2605 synthase
MRDSDDKKRDDGVEEFTRDKRRRNRTVSVEAVTRSPRVERGDEGERPERSPERSERPERPERFSEHRSERPYERRFEHSPERRHENSSERPARRSYNPNFSADNRFTGDRKPERDFNRWDTPSERPRRQWDGSGQHSYGERKPYPPRTPSDRPPYGNRPPGPGGGGKPYGQKKPFHKKSFAKRGEGGMEAGAKPEFYPSYSISDSSKELRLNRFIAMSGKCSRREADQLIQSGEVTVNGNVVTEMGVKVMPTDDIRLKGERLSSERKVYIIINKPKGFVTSVDDPHAEKTVMDIVRNACTERIYPVGRLDKSSVGVLLLTNDGDLTEKLTHPSHNKRKVYQVTLERPLTNMDLQKARDGIDLDDGVIIPDAVDFVRPDNRKEVGIEIHSGRNRIVRRIFEELGYGVHKLDRVYFAGLTKKNLKRGQWRFLTDKEVAMLKSGRYE